MTDPSPDSADPEVMRFVDRSIAALAAGDADLAELLDDLVHDGLLAAHRLIFHELAAERELNEDRTRKR